MSSGPRDEQSVPEVDAIIAEYLQRMDSGEQVDRDELLRAHPVIADELRDFFAAEVTLEHQGQPNPGPFVGPYKLLQQIGEGGMGTVWLADQERPIRRRVALKLIRQGLDSKEIVARFEAERQALAMMDHQNIAKVLDAGVSRQGRPYFVMELVEGSPLTQYCDKNRLTLDERLKLFIPVCQAVQHAHQKGVIHRDIKPSNVMVTLYEGKPVPKVIDFGLAKALQPQIQLTDKTLLTEFGKVVGTVQYMSPEQAELNTLGIDTRTDIYSLGVMLYELLTGSTPLDQDTARQHAIFKLLEMIREQDPPRPSDRLSASGDAITSISNQRKIEPQKLRAILRGELDWVVMKALDKDRSRRYESAASLADDVRRFLSGDAVTARPPSTAYRLKKVVRKHRLAVSTGTAILLVMVAGIAGTSWQAVRARRAELEIRTALLREQSARQQADDLARRNQAVVNAFVAAFRSPDPDYGIASSDMSALDVLNQALTRLDDDAEVAKDPLTKATLLHAIGESMLTLGAYDQAIAACESSSELKKEQLGPDDPQTLLSLLNLAAAYNYDGRTSEAIELLKKALERQRKVLGADHPDTLLSMNALASFFVDARRIEEAVALQELTLRLRSEKLGPSHIQTLTSINNLGNTYISAGRLKDAEAMLESAVARMKAHLGGDHPRTMDAVNNLSYVYWSTGRQREALQLMEQVVELNTAKLGAQHPKTLAAVNNLAMAYGGTGRLEQAIPLHERTLATRVAVLGPDHPHTLFSMHNLADAYRSADRLDEGRSLFEKSIELKRTKLGPHHPDILQSIAGLTEVLLQAKQFEEAETAAQDWLQLLEAQDTEQAAEMGRALASYAEALLGMDQLHEAAQQIELARNIPELEAIQLWRATSIQGALLAAQQNCKDAEPMLIEAATALCEQLDSMWPSARWYVSRAHERVIAQYVACDKPDEIGKWEEKLAGINRSIAELRSPKAD